jgi:hypothetical protein
MDDDDNTPISADLLMGVTAIAAELGWPERRTYHYLEHGHLAPAAYKLGGKWVANRRALRAQLAGPPQ